MYKTPKFAKSTLVINDSVEGETLEEQIERMISNKEPLTDKAPLVFQERKEGVKAETNIRTDRFEIAIDAMTRVQKSYSARREERMAELEKEQKEKLKNEGGAQSTQGTQQAGK